MASNNYAELTDVVLDSAATAKYLVDWRTDEAARPDYPDPEDGGTPINGEALRVMVVQSNRVARVNFGNGLWGWFLSPSVWVIPAPTVPEEELRARTRSTRGRP